MPLSEHLYPVAGTFKMTASNFAWSLNIPPQKLFRWFRRPKWWATGNWQLHHKNAPAYASHLVQSFFGKTSNHLVTHHPYSPDLVHCNFWLFPKLKSPLKGKRFQIINEIKKNVKGQLMVIGRTVWGPKVPTLKGTEESLSYVRYFLYLVSSSINVSFSYYWLDTFWPEFSVHLLLPKLGMLSHQPTLWLQSEALVS